MTKRKKKCDCGLTHWTIIKMEAYCTIDCDNTKNEFWYDIDGNKSPNPEYDPSAPVRERPEYCPVDPPRYICLANGCPWFAYCESDEE